MKKSNPLWWQIFITEYLQNGQKAGPAYRKCHPKVKVASADTEGGKLLRKPEFSLLLEEAQSKARKSMEMTRDDWLKKLEEIIDSKIEMNAAAKMKAFELVGKASGWVKEKIEILPDEDLRKLINERRRRVFGDDPDKDE